MDIKFTEEQQLIRKSARQFLMDKCPSSLLREMVEGTKGYSDELWRQMAELGWMALIFPEEFGGTGGNFMELILLLEEMGRACLPGPFFSTVVLGGLTILEAGTKQQKQELLPKIAKGELIATLAITESESDYDPSSITVTAKAKGESFIVHGTKLFVPNAHVADYLLCVARTEKGKDPEDGITLFVIDGKAEGIKYTLLNTMAKDKQYEIFFNKVRVPKENVLGELNKGWGLLKKILQKAALAKCAEMVGGGQQVLDMAVSYAKKRVQFGKPIGSFQAIQHHCSNMLVDLDGCRWVTYKGAWMIDEDIPYEKEVSIAKAWCNDAFRRIVALGHQVIGGVGYCEDHDMPLYFRMGRMAEITFGDSDFHREIVAKQLFSAG